MNVVRRTAVLVVGTVGLLPLLVVGLAGLAAADAPTKTGWWNAASANGFSLPVPTTGANDLHIGKGANGPTAYAAVAYDLSGQAVSGATLELKVVNKTLGTIALTACPTKDLAWKAGGNQPYDTAPKYDCANAVRGLVAADGAKVTFLLEAAQLLDGASYSLAIVPSATAQPFTVDFAKPDATSLSPELVDEPATEPGPAAAPPAYVPPAASGTAPLGPAAIAAPPAFAVVQPPAVAVPVAPAPQAAPPPVAPALAAVNRPVEPVSNRDRYTAGTMLALLAGALVWAFQQPAKAPRLIGGMARKMAPELLPVVDVRPRGIGRFSTLRTAPARSLV